jgi:hypothetical protein
VTVWKTEELKKRYEAKRELSRPFWKPSPIQAALLSAADVVRREERIAHSAFLNWTGRGRTQG